MGSTLILISVLLLVRSSVEGTFYRPVSHTLPDGLQVLYGSADNGGCPPACNSVSNVCGNCDGGINLNSTLVDGVFPRGMIDTNQPNWAEDFFTINRNGNMEILIGFSFSNLFTLRGVELKLFNCQTMQTSIPNFNVYRSLSFPEFYPQLSSTVRLGSYQTDTNINCFFLTTIIIIPSNTSIMSRIVFIQFVFPEMDTNTALYLAEVRFSDEPIVVNPGDTVSSTPVSISTSAPATSMTSQLVPNTSVPVVTLSSNIVPSPTITDSGYVVTTTIPPVTQTTSPNSVTDSGSVVTTATPPDIQTTPSNLVMAQSVPNTLTTSVSLFSESTTSTNNPSGNSQLSAVIGSLVVIIITLILVMLMGTIIFIICYKISRKQKKRNSNVTNLNDAAVEPGSFIQQQELDCYDPSSAAGTDHLRKLSIDNDHYDNPKRRMSDLSSHNYEDTVNYDDINESFYSEIGRGSENKGGSENKDNLTSFDEDNDNDINPFSKHRYSIVKSRLPPPVPAKSPELYRSLKVEAETANMKENLGDDDPEKITVDVCIEEGIMIGSSMDNGEEHLRADDVSLSASANSRLFHLSRPLLTMDTNPNYETIKNAADADTISPYTDDIYANPDAISVLATAVKVNTDYVYDAPRAVSKSAEQIEPGTDMIYANPDVSLPSASRKEDDIYTEPDVRTVTAPEVEANTDDIYTDLDADESSLFLPRTELGSNSALEYMYADADTTIPGHSTHAIYDVVYSESSLASIFDPQADPPVYENTVSDDELLPYAPIYILDSTPEIPLLEVSPENIRSVRKLGAGYFGQVILADTVGLSLKDLKMSETNDDKTVSIQVAVKTLQPSSSKTTRESFDKEYKFMSKLSHPNVIRLLGVCTGDAPYIMMEYLKNGDLNQYLQRFECVVNSEPDRQEEISIKTLVHMCLQICDAMRYLALHNYIHRDLAARNCLIGDANVVKLSDFGMSRSLYESHYYLIKGRAVLPVRWMSTECFYGKFSVNSDIWAFGVTMWEILTMTKILPYEFMSDKEVTNDALKREKRHLLQKPDCCPDNVFNIMEQCWVHVPRQRATFDQLFQELSSLYRQP